MKNIFLFFVAASFLFSCNRGIKDDQKTTKNDLCFYKLKGEIKSLSEATYIAIGDSDKAIKGQLVRTQNWIFDVKGNFIDRRSKRVGDSVVHFSILRYDTAEHLLKDSSNDFMGTTWSIYLYDNKGYRIERDQYYLDRGKAIRGITEIYKLDDKGNKIEEDSYWGNKDSLNYKACIKNNGRGQETEKTTLDYKGNPFIKVLRRYDDKGNQVEYQRYNNHDSLESKTTYQFDKNGNEIENCTYKKDGKLESKGTSKYDDKGNHTESKSMKEGGSVLSIYSNRYENFDKEGNWLKCTNMRDGKPEIITERTIEYYQ